MRIFAIVILLGLLSLNSFGNEPGQDSAPASAPPPKAEYFDPASKGEPKEQSPRGEMDRGNTAVNELIRSTMRSKIACPEKLTDNCIALKLWENNYGLIRGVCEGSDMKSPIHHFGRAQNLCDNLVKVSQYKQSSCVVRYSDEIQKNKGIKIGPNLRAQKQEFFLECYYSDIKNSLSSTVKTYCSKNKKSKTCKDLGFDD